MTATTSFAGSQKYNECLFFGHEFEDIGNTERIDRDMVSIEYECLRCRLTQYDYREDILTITEDNPEL